jgi:tricorn protease
VASPLIRPELGIAEGDIIQSVNGMLTTGVNAPELLLKNQVGQQVLLHLKRKRTGEAYDAIVKPISLGDEENLRYTEWEYTRRLRVEEMGKGEIGYVHLRAMGGGNYTEWVKSFYPVYDRKGLIIDVRHNRGGNIDSWILEKLMRKAWFYWQGRVGKPTWNMQYAFRGHMVVLCNERTASDGEAFAEGFRRLGLGKVLGVRTWGGEIWLSSSNFLVDRGIATAAETGVFGPDGEWLIEGRGVEPDIVVDDLPHATFEGEDAQLDAAVKHLQELIKAKPVEPPKAPAYPNKAMKY